MVSPCPKCGDGTREELMPPGHTHHGKLACACGWWKWMPKPRPKGERRPSSLSLGKKYGRGFCENCLREFPGNTGLHGHHIIEVRNGGSDGRDNIRCLCRPCHTITHSLRKIVSEFRRIACPTQG